MMKRMWILMGLVALLGAAAVAQSGLIRRVTLDTRGPVTLGHSLNVRMDGAPGGQARLALSGRYVGMVEVTPGVYRARYTVGVDDPEGKQKLSVLLFMPDGRYEGRDIGTVALVPRAVASTYVAPSSAYRAPSSYPSSSRRTFSVAGASVAPPSYVAPVRQSFAGVSAPPIGFEDPPYYAPSPTFSTLGYMQPAPSVPPFQPAYVQPALMPPAYAQPVYYDPYSGYVPAPSPSVTSLSLGSGGLTYQQTSVQPALDPYYGYSAYNPYYGPAAYGYAPPPLTTYNPSVTSLSFNRGGLTFQQVQQTAPSYVMSPFGAIVTAPRTNTLSVSTAGGLTISGVQDQLGFSVGRGGVSLALVPQLDTFFQPAAAYYPQPFVVAPSVLPVMSVNQAPYTYAAMSPRFGDFVTVFNTRDLVRSRWDDDDFIAVAPVRTVNVPRGNAWGYWRNRGYYPAGSPLMVRFSDDDRFRGRRMKVAGRTVVPPVVRVVGAPGRSAVSFVPPGPVLSVPLPDGHRIVTWREPPPSKGWKDKGWKDKGWKDDWKGEKQREQAREWQREQQRQWQRAQQWQHPRSSEWQREQAREWQREQQREWQRAQQREWQRAQHPRSSEWQREQAREWQREQQREWQREQQRAQQREQAREWVPREQAREWQREQRRQERRHVWQPPQQQWQPPRREERRQEVRVHHGGGDDPLRWYGGGGGNGHGRDKKKGR